LLQAQFQFLIPIIALRALTPVVLMPLTPTFR